MDAIKIITIYYRFLLFPLILYLLGIEVSGENIFLLFITLSFQWMLDLFSFYKLKDTLLNIYVSLLALLVLLLNQLFNDNITITLFLIIPLSIQFLYLYEKRNNYLKMIVLVLLIYIIFLISRFFNIEKTEIHISLNKIFLLSIYLTTFFSTFSFMIRKNEEKNREYDELKSKIYDLENPSEQKNKLYYMGQLATTVMHELKNPISTIHNLAETANTDNIGREQRSKNLDLISREVSRLSDMAYEIMDFVNGEMKLNLQEINLHEFIDEVYSFIKIDFEKSGIKLYVDLQFNANLKIDSIKMRRVLVNLAKYSLGTMSDKKRKYTLTITSSKMNNKLYLSLIDNGEGLPEEIEGSIFNFFTNDGNFHGTGVGLFMSKRTVEVHGGVLTYSTKKNEGSTFTIILPI